MRAGPLAAKIMSNGLGKGERAILKVIAQFGGQGGASREQITVMTGYKRSSRDTYLQRLSVQELVEPSGGNIMPTQRGINKLGSDYEPLPTGAALQQFWQNKLPAGERLILQILLEAYPNPVDREKLSEETDYKRSSRDTYLQRMLSRKIITVVGRGEVKASVLLFD